jgi:heme A synthase
MEATVAHIERILAIVFGIVVFFVAIIALRNDWKSQGIENQVFKIMLGLLALGAILGILAALGVLIGKGVA